MSKTSAGTTEQNVPPGRIAVAEDGTLSIGRSRSCDVVISHPTVSRRHAQLTANAGQFWIEDLDSDRGTWVNGVLVRRVVLRSGDLVRFGSGPAYRFDGRELLADEITGGMQIDVQDLGVDCQGETKIDRVSLSIAPNSVVAILGPSGTGKTLLLHCLAGIGVPTRGNILFDSGHSVDHVREEYQAMVGLVTQDDLVHGYLSVHENLQYAAKLRLPSDLAQEINRRVDHCLTLVGLAGDRDKRVDVLSGGQRKRVSIAIELLLRPRLLLLDEPTSGLDPGTAAQVFGILRSLSRQGITVTCTTHATETLHFVVRAIVLGQRDGVGEVAFDGFPGDMLAAFHVGNAPDLFDRLLSLNGARALAPGEVDRPAPQSRDTSVSPVLFLPRQRPSNAMLTRQAWLVTLRTARSFHRDRFNCLTALALPPVLALLTVYSQHSQPKSTFISFFLVVSAIWLGMTATVREVVRERKHYIKDRNAALAPTAYLGGKLLFAILLNFVQALLLGLPALVLVYLLKHVLKPDSLAAADFLDESGFMRITILWLTCFAGSVTGLLVSVIAASEAAAVTMLPLWILPQMLLSRVSSGSAADTWSTPSPFAPIVKLAEYFRSQDLNLLGGLEALSSLPLFSRPATAVLAMAVESRDSRSIDTWTIVAEVIYGLLLLSSYVLVLLMVFKWRERKWQDLR